MNKTNTKECGAKTRSGEPCKRAPRTNGRCNLHGGLSLGGLASPRLKHGRHSKYLPAELRERYDAGLVNKELLSLRDDIALITVRTEDVLSRLDNGESGALWAELKRYNEKLRRAQVEGNSVAMATALNEMQALIDAGHSDSIAWTEITCLLQERAKLVMNEHKALAQNRQMVSVEEALLVMRALIESVKMRVKDPQILRAVQDEFIRLSGIAERSDHQ